MPSVDKFKRKSLNLSTAIETIYGLKTDNEPDKILHILSSTFSEMLDFKLHELLEIEPNQFISKIAHYNYNCSFLDLISRLIFEGAEFFRSANQKANALHFEKIQLTLLKYLSATDKTYSPEREDMIVRLESQL